MNNLRSGPVDLVSNATGTDLWNPMTEAFSTNDIKEIRFAISLSGLGLLKAKPAVQFSNDGINWTDTPAPVNLSAGSPYATTTGWTFGDGAWTSVASLGSNRRLFIRFGVLTLNTSGSLWEGAQADLWIQVKPLTANSVTVGPSRVYCNSTTALFIPLSGPIAAEDVAELRATVELASAAGSTLGVKAAWQEANEPSVPADWTTTTGFGTERTTGDGITWALDFSAIGTVTKRFLRFGVLVRNTSSATIQACQATLRVDYRS